MTGVSIILLAGGKSRRLGPLGDKNGISFAGRSLLEWQLRKLAVLKPKKVVVVLNEKNESLIHSIPTFDFDISVQIQSESDPGMAGGIRAGSRDELDGEVLVVSGNDVVDDEAFLSVQTDSDMAILGYKVSEYFPGGYIVMDGGKVKCIVEKPGAGQEPSEYVNIVVHYHRDVKKLLQAMERVQSDQDDVYERALSAMIADGQVCTMIPYAGFWQPVKFPWDIVKLDEYFLAKKVAELSSDGNYKKIGEALVHVTAEISDRAVVKGFCLIEKDVKIFENGVVQGPAYLGAGTRVGNNALCRQSFTGERCVIGFSTEVARSHLGSDVWTHSNYLGDSILGDNISFGAGALTANLRLDEGAVRWQGIATTQHKLGLVAGSDIRVGVQTSIMPGVAIGSNSMIGGGLIISEDIAENEFIYGKTELIRKPNKLDVKGLRRL